MKLEVGKSYKDAAGNILCVVSTDFKVCDGDILAIVIYKNIGNIPSCHTIDGTERQLGSMFCERIVECLGISQLPIFRRVVNMQGEEIDYLVNYKSEDNTHLGIVHTVNGDAIRCYYENGEIEVPIRDKIKESISTKLLTI